MSLEILELALSTTQFGTRVLRATRGIYATDETRDRAAGTRLALQVVDISFQQGIAPTLLESSQSGRSLETTNSLQKIPRQAPNLCRLYI